MVTHRDVVLLLEAERGCRTAAFSWSSTGTLDRLIFIGRSSSSRPRASAGDCLQRLAVEPVELVPALSLDGHEPRGLKDLEVLRNRLPGW